MRGPERSEGQKARRRKLPREEADSDRAFRIPSGGRRRGLEGVRDFLFPSGPVGAGTGLTAGRKPGAKRRHRPRPRKRALGVEGIRGRWNESTTLLRKKRATVRRRSAGAGRMEVRTSDGG